jgi:hypothetical protein
LNLSLLGISRLDAGGGQWGRVEASGEIIHHQRLQVGEFHA